MPATKNTPQSRGGTVKIKDLPKDLIEIAKKYGIPVAVGIFAASFAAFAFEREMKDGKLTVTWKNYAASVAIPLALGFIFKKRFAKKDVLVATAVALAVIGVWDSIGAALQNNKVVKPVIDAGQRAAALINKKEAERLKATKGVEGVGSTTVRRNIRAAARDARSGTNVRRLGVSGVPALSNLAARAGLMRAAG